MSMTAVISANIQIGGQTLAENRTLLGEGIINRNISVPAAKVGQLTTRTDANTGVLTMASGHGFTTSDVLDVYWTNTDNTRGARRGMTATVSTNAVTVDGGSGDDLPTNLTAVTAMEPVTEIVPPVAASGFKMFAVAAPVPAHFSVEDADSVLLTKAFPKATGGQYHWHDESGETNPMAGETPTKVLVSHGEITAQIVQLSILFD